MRIAAETILPAGISTEIPSTESETVSGMHGLLSDPCGQVRRNRNSSFAIHDLSDEEFGGAERGGDAKTLMTGREIKSLVFGVWSNQGKLVRRRGTKACPRPER